MDGFASCARRYLVWVYIAAVIIGALVFVGGIVFAVYMHEKDIALRVTIAKHEESTRAHRWIIGYGTPHVPVDTPPARHCGLSLVTCRSGPLGAYCCCCTH